MKRVWVVAAGFVLVLVLGASPAHAAVPAEGLPSSFRATGEATMQLPPDQNPVKLGPALGTRAPLNAASVQAAALNGIFAEGFESTEPAFAVWGGPGWALSDYRKSEGSYSAYCAGMFTAPPGNYAPNMDSWIIAGPFDLSMYSSAQVSFDAWAAQVGQDYLFAGVSADGEYFSGKKYTGSTNGAWASQSIDISAYRGEPEVWLLFAFTSDGVDQAEGVYIDRVAVTGSPVPALNPIFRFYNFTNGTHFYTPSAEERDSVIARFSNVYSYDGVAYYTSVYNNSQPLHRFYNRRSGGHFYTASTTEANAVLAKWPDVFQYEGTTYAVNPWPVANSAPVYRFYNKQNGTHFYTASAEERDMVMSRWPNVYSYEGPAFWVGQQQLPAAVTNTAPGEPIGEPLWQPPAAALPATGNYIYLESAEGDVVGGGETYLYTHDNASISFGASGRHMKIRIAGAEHWNGDFQITSYVTAFEVGYYPYLSRYPFQDPEFGGLSWSCNGRGGGESLTGWFFVDSATYVSGKLTAIELRFEQQAEEGEPPLRGKIRWRAADAPPSQPSPTLWQPLGAALPDTDTYVYLDSDIGDYIGIGHEYFYTPEDSLISVSSTGGRLNVSVSGDEWWNGTFQLPSTYTQLEVGHYAGLTRYPSYDPAVGGMSWYGESRASNTLIGWVYIDSVSYVDGALSAIDLRFEQFGDGRSQALHGRIRWRADDPTVPLGPVNPIPAELWEPSANAVPTSGDYVYLDSDPGDYVGGGREYFYTPANSAITVSATGGRLFVFVNGSEWWYGTFQAMSGLSSLEEGYYPKLTRYPFHNPARGGMDWYGQGRGSNELTGWFAVDNATYVDGVLTEIDVRFEQHCEGGPDALYGAIHWSADE